MFHFQRIEALTGDLSDGTQLEDFHREQWGGTFGGPLKTDKAFIFAALEGITGNFKRPNLGRQLGDTPCPVANPTIQQNEALINAQRRLPAHGPALSFFQSPLNMNEATPIEHPVKTIALLTKLDRRRERRRTTSPDRGTSITRGRPTRRSTSRPTARPPTASKAIRRASTS